MALLLLLDGNVNFLSRNKFDDVLNDVGERVVVDAVFGRGKTLSRIMVLVAACIAILRATNPKGQPNV